MSTNRLATKGRLAAYTNKDEFCDINAVCDGINIIRMDSLDCDRVAGHQQSRAKVNILAHQPHSICCSRTLAKHRDLSAEGQLRTQHFHKAHSAVVSSGNRLLRFSDESFSSSGGSATGFNERILSAGNLPLHRSRGNSSPQSSSCGLERLSDPQKTSMERPNYSPSRGTDGHRMFKLTKSNSRKLQHQYSTDSHESCSPPKTNSSNDNSNTSVGKSDSDTRSRRSQFRRAISLFSLSCDKDTDRKEKTTQKILRPPTRHVYRRGVSGLPIECTSRSLGVVH